MPEKVGEISKPIFAGYEPTSLSYELMSLCYIRRFTASERIDDYKCDSCNARETATTQFTIRQLPPVLSLVLERFQRSAGKTQKNETPVSFAEELDMREYTSWGKESLKQGRPLDCLPEFKYNLFAVVTPEGTYQSGHYKTYTRTANKVCFC